MPSQVKWNGPAIERQVRFGIARGLTQVAKASAAEVSAGLRQVFDRPTPYTMRSIGYAPANRENLTSKVFVRPDQLRYLERQIEGGERRPSPGSPVNVPAAAPLNAYGNLPRKAIKRYIAQKTTFVADGTGRTAHLKPGVYRRGKVSKRRDGSTGSMGASPRLQLLVSFKPVARYSKRFGFVRMVERAATPKIAPTIQASIAQALATAR